MARTEASVVFADENGIEKQVIPLDGRFVDNVDSLQFGQGEDRVDIILSSDACNSAVATPPYISQDVDEEDEEEENKLEAEEDEGYELDTATAADASISDDGKENGIFKRGLRDPSTVPAKSSTGTGASPSKAVAIVVDPSPSEVLARHRDLFAKAKIASREGRKLTTGVSFPVNDDDW